MNGIKVSVDMLVFVVAAFDVLGLIEWVKSLVESVKKAFKLKDFKPLTWVALSFGLSIGVAITIDGGAFQILFSAATILAINEIVGYNMVVKVIFSLIDRLTGEAGTTKDELAAAQKKIADMQDGGSA
jgi:hypothetical protein